MVLEISPGLEWTWVWMQPASKVIISLDAALLLFELAILANIAYCAAYVVDIFAQASGFREGWRKLRWILLFIGVLFASVLTRWFAIGIFTNLRD